MEQEYIVENINSFNLVHIFECGQCFRWNKQLDGSYTGVIKDAVLNVKQDENKIIFKGIVNGDIKDICTEYFDLNEDYEKIKIKLSQIDENMKNSINYGSGIRILKQDLWEMIISFIISANNNIPRIKGIIERICKKYGQEIVWNDNKYYTFPTPEELKCATVQDLRDLGLGFRDVRVYETTKIIYTKQIDLCNLSEMQDVETLRNILLTLPGVGPKVADCIMLFSLKKLEVFPIDVWVRRVMSELYFETENSEKGVAPNKLQKLAKEKYGNLAGIAQQYLFYWRREA